MRYLSCFLSFNLLIVTSQALHPLVARQLSLSSTSPDSLVVQGYGDEDGSLDDDSSPSRGSDRRDS
jgi:hypothetical protein